jgi:hypothetical protein
MNIIHTGITNSILNGETAHLEMDCSDSTCAKRLVVMLSEGQTAVIVEFHSGSEWVYLVPKTPILSMLGEQSVGRFVAHVKKVATTSHQVGQKIGVTG